MATEWISPTWRMPNDKNQSKFESYSLDFNGTDYITSDFTNTDNTGSVSIWVNPTNYTTGQQVIWCFNGVGYRDYIGLFQLSTGVIGFETADNGVNKWRVVTTSAAVSNGSWTNLTCTFNGSNAVIYVNGVAVSQSYTHTSDVTYWWDNLIPTNYRLGVLQVPGYSTGQYYNGKISNSAMWSVALTSDQINYLWNSGTPQNPMAISGQPPIAYYPLGGSSTGDATVVSPSTLTVPNESVPSATVFDFNSSNINVGDIDNAGALSFSTWLSTTSTNASSYQNIAYKRNGSTGWFIQYLYGSGTDGKIKFYIFHTNGVGTGSEVTITNLQSGDWFNIALTYDGTDAVGALKLYSNGTEVYSNSSTLGGTGIAVNNDDLYFGGSASSAFFTCKLSNIQLWDTGLSAPNVTTIYNNGVPLFSGTQPQAANLKAWYPMNVDNANWLGSDWQIADATSAYPQSFEFDGSSDEIIVSNDSALQIDGDITISAWIYAESDTGRIVSKRGGGGTNYDFYIESRYLRLYDGGTGPFSTGRITLNQWTHILISVTSGTGTYYIDNVAAGTGTFSISSVSTSQPFFIGGAYTPVLANFDGKMSNVQIWNTGLNASQVETLYNNGSPLTTAIESSNLKAWYKLDNSATFSTNWSVPDASGNGNTGTSSGMTESNLVNNNVSALNGTSDGMTTANLVNSDLTRSIPYSSYSMEFDGTADHIDCGATAYLDNLTEMSCSIWFNLDTSAINKGLIDDNDKHFAIYTKSVSGSDYSFRININGSANRVNITGTPFTAGQWHHLVMTFNAGTLTFYADGIVVGSTVYSGSIPTSLSGTTGNLDIGTYGTLYWDGKISNAAIFNAVLTQDQVLTIYNGGVPNSISSLSPIGWWSLAGDSYFNGSDWICPDLGSGGNNGTSSGMGGSELVGNAPGGSANGTATNMDIPANLKGNAPNSSSNAFSVNMDSQDRVASVPS